MQRPANAMRANPAWCPKLEKFHKHTQRKNLLRQALLLQRRFTTPPLETPNPYSVGGSTNPNTKLRLGHVLSPSAKSGCQGVRGQGGVVRVLNMTAAALPLPRSLSRACKICPRPSAAALWGETLRADLVVWDSVWELDNTDPTSEILKSAFIMIAAGGAIISRDA